MLIVRHKKTMRFFNSVTDINDLLIEMNLSRAESMKWIKARSAIAIEDGPTFHTPLVNGTKVRKSQNVDVEWKPLSQFIMIQDSWEIAPVKAQTAETTESNG
jgi:hypothetical protein